jgi:hypothetical protein
MSTLFPTHFSAYGLVGECGEELYEGEINDTTIRI